MHSGEEDRMTRRNGKTAIPAGPVNTGKLSMAEYFAGITTVLKYLPAEI